MTASQQAAVAGSGRAASQEAALQGAVTAQVGRDSIRGRQTGTDSYYIDRRDGSVAERQKHRSASGGMPDVDAFREALRHAESGGEGAARPSGRK